MREVQIAVFAKAPIAGQAKTRLIPALGAEGAALFHEQMVRNTVKSAVLADIGPVTVWCDLQKDHAMFNELANSYPITLQEQPEGDLGERLLYAVEQMQPPLLLIGCDCPMLDVALLQQCSASLQQHDVVILPAEDGGYALLGMNQIEPTLFRGIAWGEDSVMATTRERLKAKNINWTEPAEVWDVDRPEDLQRLKQRNFLQR